MEYIKFLKSKKILLLAVGVVIVAGITGFSFYAERVPTYKITIEPIKLLPFVSHKQARMTICSMMKGQLFDEICQNKFDSVGKNDAEKIGALFSLLKKIEDDRGTPDYERLLLAQAVFASFPTKDSSITQRREFPILLVKLKNLISEKNIVYAKESSDNCGKSITSTEESNDNLGMGEKAFRKKMMADLKEVVNNLPEGDNAWTINIMVSKYGWADGMRQPLYSQTYGESFDPYPGVSTENKSQWEKYDLNHVRSRVGAFATNQAMYSGPLKEGSGEMIGYSFSIASWKSHPYGSDSELVLSEAGPSEKYLTSRMNYSDENYQGNNLLSDLLDNVKMPFRQQQGEDQQEKSESQKTIPPHGTPISKSDYSHIIDEPGCDPWMVYPETGVYCFTEEEMNAIGASGDLGQIRNKPPTYPFCDGNEPWQAPEESPAEQPSSSETPSSSIIQDEKEYRRWLDRQ